MDVSDLFRALGMAFLPLFLLSFGLVWWALHRGRLEGESVSDLQRSIESLGKARKDKDDPQKVDPVLEKWFRFGGGFYGSVALYTWLLIEWDDVADFLGGLGDIVLNFDPGALISLVINLFIESIMNFVAAIAWPAYWLGEARNPWLWILLAYGGYWLGIKAAQHAAGKRWGGAPDEFLDPVGEAPEAERDEASGESSGQSDESGRGKDDPDA